MIFKEFLKNSRILVLTLCLFLNSYGLLARELARATPPEWVQNYILFEQKYNELRRLGEKIDKEKGAPLVVSVYEVDPSLPGLSTIESLYHEGYLRDLSHSEDGKIRLFVVHDNGIPYLETARKLRSFGIKPLKTMAAVRIQGHSSYLAWDPADENQNAFFIKTQKYLKGDAIVNPYENLKLAVTVSEQIENILGEKRNRFLPERMAAELHLTGTNLAYGFLLRDASTLKEAFQKSKETGFEILPLHGLLDPVHSHANVDWLNEKLIPKLAAFVACLHYQYGVFPILHAQNLLVRFNKKTLEVDGFLFRDGFDTMIDPMVALSQNLRKNPKSSVTETLKNIKPLEENGLSLLNIYHVEENTASNIDPKTSLRKYEISEAGYNAMIYLGQPLFSLNHPAYGADEIKTFIDNYRSTAEKITKIKLDFQTKPNVSSLLKQVNQWVLSKSRIPDAFHNREHSLGGKSFVFKELIQAVYNEIATNRLYIDFKPERSAEMTSALSEIALKRIFKDQKILYTTPQHKRTLKRMSSTDDTRNLEFYSSNNAVFARLKGQHTVAAVIWNLSGKELEAIRNVEVRCEAHLKLKRENKKQGR